MRARDAGLQIGAGTPGPFNAITDGAALGDCVIDALKLKPRMKMEEVE